MTPDEEEAVVLMQAALLGWKQCRCTVLDLPHWTRRANGNPESVYYEELRSRMLKDVKC